MRAHYQLAIGIGAAITSMAVNLLVVPAYTHLLGVEAYGLIGFLLTLFGVLQVLDLGLAPTTSREVARGQAHADFSEARQLLTTLETVYLATGAVIFGIVVLLSWPIATDWLQPDKLDSWTVARAVMLIGLILGLRWPAGIYAGVLTGAHQVNVVSVVTLLFNAGASLTAIPLLWLAPRIEVLFCWQAFAALLQLISLRRLAWRALGGPRSGHFSAASLKAIWRFSAGMSGITLTAVLLQQVDKVAISRLVSLQAFGIYTLAVLLGRALYGLINPIYNIIYPRFTVLAANGRLNDLAGAYRYWTLLFSCLFFPASMVMALGAEPLVTLWTGDTAVVATMAPLVSLIAIGAAFHGVMYFPFALQVALGDSRTPFMINLVLLIVYVPLLIVLFHFMGLPGAAWASVTLYLFYLLFGTWATHRRLLPAVCIPWLVGSVLAPFAVSAAVGTATSVIVSGRELPPTIHLAIAAGAGAASAGLTFAVAVVGSSALRCDMRRLFGLASGTA